MAEAEILVFSTPACSACHKTEQFLLAKGLKYRMLDVSADHEALVMLLRITGQPVVPAVVAYGEVMVGFDPARLEEMLQDVQARADAFARARADEEEHLRRSEEMVKLANEVAGFGDDDDIDRLLGEPAK